MQVREPLAVQESQTEADEARMKSGGSIAASFERHTAFEDLSFSGGTLTVHVLGPSIGEREAAILTREIGGTIDSLRGDIRSLVIDLVDVETLSGLAVGLFLDLRDRCRWRTSAVLTNVKPDLVRLLASVGLDRKYRIEAIDQRRAA